MVKAGDKDTDEQKAKKILLEILKNQKIKKLKEQDGRERTNEQF